MTGQQPQQGYDRPAPSSPWAQLGGGNEVVVGLATTPQSLASNTLAFVTFDTWTTYPNGWLETATYTSSFYGITVPANSSIALPPGVYAIEVQGKLASDPGAGKSFFAFADFADDVPLDPVMYGSTFSFPLTAPQWAPGNTTASTQFFGSGIVRITPAMAGLRIGGLAKQDNAGAINLTKFGLAIVRLV